MAPQSLISLLLLFIAAIGHFNCERGHGRVVFQGNPDDFGANSAVRKEWLEV